MPEVVSNWFNLGLSEGLHSIAQVDNPEATRFIGRTEALFSEENWVELVAHLLSATDALFEKELSDKGEHKHMFCIRFYGFPFVEGTRA